MLYREKLLKIQDVPMKTVSIIKRIKCEKSETKYENLTIVTRKILILSQSS